MAETDTVERLSKSVTFEAVKDDGDVQRRLQQLDTLHYHNYSREPSRHVERVVGAAEELAKFAGLDVRRIELIKIAALLHDINYPEGSGGHEERSAQTAEQTLQRLGMNEEEREIVTRCIRATHGEYANGTYVTNPQTIEEMIICAADMSPISLAPAEFLPISDQIRREINVGKIAQNLPEITPSEWWQGQEAFVRGVDWHMTVPSHWEVNRQKNEAAVDYLASNPHASMEQYVKGLPHTA